MSMAPKYSDLQKLSLSQLKQEYDKLAGNTMVGLNFIHEEILRREQNRVTCAMIALTVAIAFLALVQTVIMVINLFA